MADHKPINWAYPFPSKDTNCNPLQLLTHMAQAKGGFYPTGENGLWHGGVHFDEGTAVAFDQSSVRCIADGEVVAYRIDERYPVSEFTDDIPLVKRAPFSTGFVLVKHSLQPPPLKNAGGSIVEGQTPPSISLYSLYMHLLDWAGYQAQPDLPRPAFWETRRYTVNTQNQGLSVRAGPSKSTTKLSELSKGAEITIGRVEGEFSKLVSLVSGTAQPALSADDEGHLTGYVSTSLLKPHSEPAEYDKVVVLNRGVPIKAGELIGHPGLYQNHDSAAQHMVHVELFSCDDVPAFIAQSRAWASRLPDDQKTLLKIYKGASKLIPHRDDINADNPPTLDDDGTQIGVDLIIPQSLLDGLPASRKIQIKDGADNTMHWWRLDGLFADANGNPIDGWLAEQELITTRHSPWEWEGFQCVEETGTPVEKLAYAFNAKGLLSADEQHNYRAQISKADGGPIVTLARLYDIADTDKDGVLTSTEIQAALAKPWHAQVLGQLITKYESEWFWKKDKWDELDPLLAEEPGKPNLVWEVEKQRIEKLSWWGELVGQHGFSEDREAWHIQTIGLMNNFSLIDDENDLKWLKVPRGQLTFDAEGNDIEDSLFFSRVPHWPPVGASGVTIGRGYDVGHQPNVKDDLECVGISEPLLSWLSGGKGLTKSKASDYLNSATARIRSTHITRKQQHDLFVFVYEFMEKDVRRICEKRDVIEAYGATDWDALHPKIKDMLVDLRYRGDYTPDIRALLQEYVASNDLARFSSVIKNRSNWPQNLPSDRFLRRSRYIDE
ncbi:pesticin C-terminus-like muramidase [Stutzerimonas marianensis]